MNSNGQGSAHEGVETPDGERSLSDGQGSEHEGVVTPSGGRVNSNGKGSERRRGTCFW